MTSRIWLQTFTGLAFHLLGDDPHEIDIVDIAHALARICRFTGHTREHYSVAEHCVRVSYACDPADALSGLMHDAHEAYVGDVAQPIKLAMRELRGVRFRRSLLLRGVPFPVTDMDEPETEYDELEYHVERRVARKFGLTLPWPESVKRADLVLLATEARDLLIRDDADVALSDWDLPEDPLPERITPWKYPEVAFLERFHDLTGARRP